MSRNTIQTKLAQPFVTESGYRFNEPDVACNTWGELNSSRDDVVLICHALTGNSRADEWFPGLFAEGGLIDVEEQFVICINVPGSYYGSVGPTSINPETGRPWRASFADLPIRDIAGFQRLVLDELGSRGVEFYIVGCRGRSVGREIAMCVYW